MAIWIATAVLAAAAATAPPPEPATILHLPPALSVQLQARLADDQLTDKQRLHRIVDFVFDRDGLALTYDDTKTRTVAEVFEAHKANCLSFTLLFLALSRDAGFDSHAQELGQVVAWHQDANNFYATGHVNAGLRIGGTRWTADLDRSVLSSPHTPTPITDRRLLAHFYDNRGTELMADGQTGAARTYLQASLDLAPDLAAAWNNFGVLALREGDAAAAAEAYDHAVAADGDNASALSNLVNLYRRTGDSNNADIALARLRRLQDRDPMQQFLLATEAERRGSYRDAVKHYRRAIGLYDGAHQFHFGLARTYFVLGKPAQAQHELQRAFALSAGDPSIEQRYADKLDGLRRWNEASAAQQPRTVSRR